jgi:hypothetical protein
MSVLQAILFVYVFGWTVTLAYLARTFREKPKAVDLAFFFGVALVWPVVWVVIAVGVYTGWGMEKKP